MRVLTCLAALVIAGFAADASGQSSTVYVVMNDTTACLPPDYDTGNCHVTRLLRATLAPSGGAVDWVRDVPRIYTPTEAYVTPDGGLVAWLGHSSTGPYVYLHDVTSGQTFSVGPFGGARFLIGNPAAPEIFVFDTTGVFALSPSGVRRFDHGCNPNDRAAISSDGRRASYTCTHPNSGQETAVFDTATGALVAILPYFGKVSLDGDHVYTREFTLTSNNLQRRSLPAGQVVAEVANPGFELVVDPVTGDVLTYSRGATSDGFFMMDATTLAQRWSASIPISVFSNTLEPVLDAASGLMYVRGTDAAITIYDRVARVSLGTVTFRAQQWLTIATGPAAPAAPVLQPPSVQGANVALAWTPPGVSSPIARYVLEVGSGPGRNDIFGGLDVGLQTTFAAGGVPPGRYYVRVRALNGTGPSAPSNEVVVQVP